MKNSFRKKVFLLLGLLVAAVFQPASVSGRSTLNLNGKGWYLWLDKKAQWSNDRLYLPAEATLLSALPVNAPTGGWKQLEAGKAFPVSVPGTVEEYMTKSDSPRPEHQKGVSWWFRKVNISAASKGNRVIIHFESVRMRAEVYLDGKLVAYDVVGESPFWADITDAVKHGQMQTLAVRVTNPGGNFHWQDYEEMSWGNYRIPPGRGFGGIIGRVWIDVVSPIYIKDIYMQNQPQPNNVVSYVTLSNTLTIKKRVKLNVEVIEKSTGQVCVVKQTAVEAIPGESIHRFDINYTDAKLWDLQNPNLYTCRATVNGGKKAADNSQRDFGFRWFEGTGIGSDAMLRLNGKRVMLRSAIGWGYWPVTGLYATPEMAVKNVNTAKLLGLNMLNFHRSIGSPVVLEAADSLGLLYLEEPGGYHAIGHDPFSRTIINEKLHRMIYRDRSHPSLVIYNMINEYGGVKARDKALVAKRMNDMREAHKVDPSRMLTFTSGWALKENDDEDSKANMRPFDSTLYRRGWFDNHRAGGPMTYEEGYYRSSKDNYMYTDNRTEIFMRGEEGAISTPPRIQLIYDEIARTGKTGWDGLFWETQYREFKSFFDKKGLAKSFGTLDSLTRELGDIQLEHQGKRLMGMRMQDLGDIYVVNGWESMPYDNHSGIVDNYRNVKGNTEAFSRYTQPLYVAVCPQRQIMKTPSTVNVDYYIVNEYRISGQYGLTVSVTSPDGVCTTVDCNNVKIKGSDIFGQLLAENVKFDINGKAGYYTLRAELKDNKGTVIATGSERVLGVDWNASELKGNGAIYADAESSVPVFFKNATGRQLPAFKPSMKKLDWIIVDRSPLDDPKPVSKSWLKNLKAKWFADNDISALAGTAADEDINHNFIDGAQPHSSLPANQSFSVIWDGEMTVPEDGVYMIGANTDNGVRLTVNGKQILDFWGNRKETTVARPFNLKKGETVTIHFEYRQLPNKGHVSLVCSSPGDVGIAPDVILDKVKNNGTTLLLVGATEKWMDVINNRSDIGYHGFYTVGKNWVGGCHFVAEHPLFAGLPTNCAMNWPYQALVHEGDKRLGLCIDNDNMVVGSYSSMPFNLGSNVGTLAYGKGTIVYSTLDITGNLCKTDGPSEVARKLLCNMISYSMK